MKAALTGGFFKTQEMEKQYTITAKSLTGKHGRVMLRDNKVPESWLLNIDEHVAQGHISEIIEQAVTEQPAPAPLTPAAIQNPDKPAITKKSE